MEASESLDGFYQIYLELYANGRSPASGLSYAQGTSAFTI